MKINFASSCFVAFGLFYTVAGSRNAWYSEQPRGLRQDFSDAYYAPFGGDIYKSSEHSWSGPSKRKTISYDTILEEEESTGTRTTFGASRVESKVHKEPSTKKTSEEKKASSSSGKSSLFIIEEAVLFHFLPKF